MSGKHSVNFIKIYLTSFVSNIFLRAKLLFIPLPTLETSDNDVHYDEKRNSDKLSLMDLIKSIDSLINE